MSPFSGVNGTMERDTGACHAHCSAGRFRGPTDYAINHEELLGTIDTHGCAALRGTAWLKPAPPRMPCGFGALHVE